MAEVEIARQVEAAQARWSLLGLSVIHRFGRVEPGAEIVLVVTASSHRHDAFAAAEFLMDYLKTRAPFWKQVEHARGKNWVASKPSDESAAERWARPDPREAAEYGRRNCAALSPAHRSGGEQPVRFRFAIVALAFAVGTARPQ
jgi:molybdopterin synthase catalytic subunit